MAQACVDCLRDTISDTAVLAAFHADTGSACTPGRMPIDRMIDEASGREREFVEQYLAWCNENVWGEECMYAQVNYPRWPAPDRLGWHARLCSGH
jgi:hypothetical protein